MRSSLIRNSQRSFFGSRAVNGTLSIPHCLWRELLIWRNEKENFFLDKRPWRSWRWGSCFGGDFTFGQHNSLPSATRRTLFQWHVHPGRSRWVGLLPINVLLPTICSPLEDWMWLQSLPGGFSVFSAQYRPDYPRSISPEAIMPAVFSKVVAYPTPLSYHQSDAPFYDLLGFSTPLLSFITPCTLGQMIIFHLVTALWYLWLTRFMVSFVKAHVLLCPKLAVGLAKSIQ